MIQNIGPGAATRSYRLGREAIGILERLAAHLKIDCGFQRKNREASIFRFDR